jgi:polar amino acid transport system substrate-binding protein
MGMRLYIDGGRRGVLALAAASLSLAACDFPKDPEHTSENVQGKVLRAGVSESPRSIRFEGSEPQGVEADLIRGLAAQMDARVEWRRGGETALLSELKRYRLDIVAGGITNENPWTKELGAARPYAKIGKEKHMVLAPPGENRWLLTIDRYQQAHKAELQAKAEAGA